MPPRLPLIYHIPIPSPAWRMLEEGSGRLVCDQLVNGRWAVKVQGASVSLRLFDDIDHTTYRAARRAVQEVERFLRRYARRAHSPPD